MLTPREVAWLRAVIERAQEEPDRLYVQVGYYVAFGLLMVVVVGLVEAWRDRWR